ncbi:trypsin-like serine protease [Anaerocolumna sedimenticola]|uniref:Trypsin-like serine protease n=1 Tax=Anaerocolumna sedimenticola TaxID=2696063 RepID=A0A6P1TQN4_9FIRM|nr:trypsin-like peptidase domain-containing protein [Anaerocolumna sedimenticola]QHQ62793.1 trypsin-like serine protease [Anaerocolumna sedimenticola]
METGNTKSNSSGDVSTVVENVMPSIVAINSTVNDVTSDFFGRQYSEDVQGSGSGIIIGQNENEILIATNNHVVANAKTVNIVFADNTTASATIKGTEPSNDLAVVSVKLSDLKEGTIDKIKIATLGDSKSVKLGEMAIAIGNALGYGQSITVGYVSALDREVTVDGVTLKVLQTDAAINPGNSGGALLNSKGEVIGINSVKYVDDNVESVGYAIPISDAIPVINELMNRTVLTDKEKAYLGIAGKDVTDDYSQRFNMPVGVYVGELKEGSAAKKAGIKVGDIIISVNNITIKTMADLQEVLGYTKADTNGTVVVKSLEDGKYVDKTINVTFDARPAGN